MSNQIVITSGAKLRDLDDVIIGTDGILSSVAFNVANGVPRLDENGKILVSQLPNSVMEFKGVWNAATNTPTLANGTGNAGDVWLCNVAGTVNFGAGPIAFAVGDYAVYTGTVWARSSGATGTVTSVGVSRDGNALAITGSPVTTSGVINLGFSGDNTQYINGAGNLTTFPTLITSIGLTMPAAFGVSNSPLTANGTIGVTALGYPSQYIRGDGTLADFPTSGGGGSSVSYYFNGGVSQGTIGGTTYYEMSKIANTGAGVDFSKTGDGFITAFLTDAGDPALLQIPAGNWNYEIYASMSANGGTPEMYAEVYVYDGITFNLIATSSHEILYDGTNLNLYSFAMAVPETVLTVTDRLAIKLYATNSGGKTTTIHTQNGHLCQVITTFTTGLTALNGLTAQVQYFGTGTSGSDFNIVSSVDTHTFNLPTASATKRGALSSADWSTFNGKQDYITAGTTLEYWRGDKTWQTLNTSVVPELTNLYFTNTRARTAISLTTTGSTGASTYNNTTGVLNIPNYADQYVGTVTSVDMSVPTGLTVSGNPITTSGTLAVTLTAGYSIPTTANQSTWTTAYNRSLTSAAVTGTTTKTLTLNQQDGGTITASWTDINTDAVTSVFGRTGAVVATEGDYTLTQLGDVTITTPSSGQVLKYNGTAWINDTDANTGTVTSVAMTVPTGLSIAGSPITSSGTLAVTFAAGYSIPTNASQTTWDTAYTNRITSLTVTGSSGASTLISNVLNIPTYTLTGLGGVPSTRTLTINGTTYDLSADRTWTIAAGVSSVVGTAPISALTVLGVATISITQATTSSNGYLSSTDWNTFNNKQGTITLTTTGTSGAATFSSNTLNIPQYQSVLTNPVTGSGTINKIAKFTTTGSTIGNSLIQDDGTYTSINGVPVTNGMLTIYNEGIFSIQFINSGTGGSTWQIGATNNAYGSGGDKFVFTYGGASLNSILTLIQATKNVSIGSTTDVSRLYVEGAHTAGRGIISVNSTDIAYLHLSSTSATATEVGVRYAKDNVEKWVLGMVGGTSGTDYTFRLLGSGLANNVFNVNLTTGITTYNYGINGTTAIFSSTLTSLDHIIKNSANTETLDLFLSPSVLNAYIDYPTSRSLIFRNKGTAGGLTLASTGAATFSSSVTATSFIKTGGTSSQYLMADGSTSTGGGGSSQWITSGSNIYYSAGKVGVGLNAAFPTALTVYETSASTTTIDSGLSIGNGYGSTGVFAGIRFGTYGDTAGSVSYPKQFIGAQRDADGAGKGDLVFANRGVADTSVVQNTDINMRIKPSGNIIIGAYNTTDIQPSFSTVRLQLNGSFYMANTASDCGQWITAGTGGWSFIQYRTLTTDRFIQGYRDADSLYHIAPGASLSTNTGFNMNSAGRANFGGNSFNGILSIQGAHVSGYGLLNLESSDSCLISMNSSTSYDVRIRYKYQSVDQWYVGLAVDTVFRWQNASSANSLTLTQAGLLTAAGDVVAYSDISLKENIRPIENVLARIINSRGVLYDRIDIKTKNNIGFIAQELENQFPELVKTNEDGTKSVAYQNAVAILFEAIKEQQKQINELKNIN